MKRYQHIVNRFDSEDCDGLLNGFIYIQSKLDGNNCQMYLDNNEIVITSRNNILSEINDKQNCYKILIKDDKYRKFFKRYPNIKLCGEWLVQHSVHYIEDSYNKFYVFDGIVLDTENDLGQCDYVNYDQLASVLRTYKILTVPYIVEYGEHFKNKMLQQNFNEIYETSGIPYSKVCNFLLPGDDNELTKCEGIVIKNYGYKNPFGRSVWCKLINHEWFKNKGQKVKKIIKYDNSAEQNFVDEKLDDHLLAKCYFKLIMDGILDKSQIGAYVQLCQTEFLDDFIQAEFITNETFNLKQINKFVAKKALEFYRSKL